MEEQQIAAENGRDWKEQVDETLEVLKYAEEKGFDMGGVIFGSDYYNGGSAEGDKGAGK